MAKPARRTIARDSVFRSLGSSDNTDHESKSKETETRQTAVWLTDEDVDWLDDMRRKARKGGGRIFTRSALIRSLIGVARDNTLDLSGLSDEQTLSQRIAAAIRDPGRADRVSP